MAIQAVGATPLDVAGIPTALPSTDPERDWYAEPRRVFDDLFFLGQTAYTVWGLRTSEGIVLVDAIFDYSVEAEVIDGLRKLGIDPGEIRYVIMSHAHGDHSAGAGILQKQYGARVVMSEADWDLHTLGTISTVMTVRDRGEEHRAMIWGGTTFNFRDAPDDPRDARLSMYAGSTQRMRDVVSDEVWTCSCPTTRSSTSPR